MDFADGLGHTEEADDELDNRLIADRYNLEMTAATRGMSRGTYHLALFSLFHTHLLRDHSLPSSTEFWAAPRSSLSP